MSKTYTKAGKALHDEILSIMEQHHWELAEAGVTVSALLCCGGLQHHGYDALAVVKINSLKCRVEGKADCTITFDGESVDDWPTSKRLAVIDHELTHLELVRHTAGPQTGQVKTDDCGRPVLKLRLHDVQIGGFREVIDRHKEAAVESQAIAESVKLVQQYFKW